MENTNETTRLATEKQLEYLKILRPRFDYSGRNLTIDEASNLIEVYKRQDKETQAQIAMIAKIWNSMSAEQQAAQLEGYGIDSI